MPPMLIATVGALIALSAIASSHKFHTEGNSGHRTGAARVGPSYFPNRQSGQRSICETRIVKQQDFIYTPNYPNDYNDSVRCSYTIERYAPDVCEVELTFLDFDLEDTSAADCKNDYLLLDGVRMCGILMPDTKKTLMFRASEQRVELTFQSDAQNARKGFMAKVQQKRDSCRGGQAGTSWGTTPNSITSRSGLFPDRDGRALVNHDLQPRTNEFCDQYIGNYKGMLRSPNWPYAYAGDAACVLTMRRAAADVCRVDLYLRRFDVNSPLGTHACTDYLELPDRRRLCGLRNEKISLQYSPSSNFMVLMFRSDMQSTGPGFEIDVVQVPNSCAFRSQRARKCDQHIKARNAELTSPNYPWPYEPMATCLYMIEKSDPSICYFQLQFNKFDLGKGDPFCDRDYFQLPDGKRVCNDMSVGIKKTYMFPRESNRIAMFYFTSDKLNQAPGYHVSVNQLTCADLDLDRSPGTTAPTFENKCDMISSDVSTEIKSLNYPSDYNSFARCTYQIKKHASDVCLLKATFLSFDLEQSADCKADYLHFEGTGDRLCGRELDTHERVIPFPTGSDHLRVTFVTDGQVNRPGFKVRLEQLRNSCNLDVDRGSVTTARPAIGMQPSGQRASRICNYSAASQMTITSEGHPRPYQPNIDCVYRIYRHNSNTCALELFMERFDVGSRDGTGLNCYNDFVEVQGQRYCGFRSGQRHLIDFPFNKDSIDVRFKTDAYRDTYTGFQMTIKQNTVCSSLRAQPVAPSQKSVFCGDKEYGAESFQLISPGYDNGRYLSFTDCHYVVKKSSYDVCALEVQFLGFALEESADCSKDYLQIGDEQKLCGKLPYQTMRTYEFGSDRMTIKFHADGEREDAGFLVAARQIKC